MRLQGAFPQLLHCRLHRLERPQNVGTGGAEHLDTDGRIAILIPELLARRRRDIDRRDIDNIRRRVVNIEKARRMLRWAPQITLSTGLERTADWMRSSSFEMPELSPTPADASPVGN